MRIKSICGLMIMLMVIMSAVPAIAESETELGVDLTYADRYVWRGLPLNEEGVYQPSVTISGGGFYINGWFNIDATDWGEEVGYDDEQGNITEIDWSAGYDKEVGPATISVGFMNYTYPHTGSGGEGKLAATTEVYLGVSADVIGSPSFTVCVDEDQLEGAAYFSLDFGHSHGLYESGEVTVGIDVSAHLGYANDKFTESYWAGLATTMDEYDDLDDGGMSDYSVGVGLPVGLPKGFSLTPSYSYISLINEDLKDVIDDSEDPEVNSEGGVFSITLSKSFAI
jgi:Bacterial protein of unknown function (Gcw_chp)